MIQLYFRMTSQWNKWMSNRSFLIKLRLQQVLKIQLCFQIQKKIPLIHLLHRPRTTMTTSKLHLDLIQLQIRQSITVSSVTEIIHATSVMNSSKCKALSLHITMNNIRILALSVSFVTHITKHPMDYSNINVVICT